MKARIGIIQELTRLRRSRNGNPRWSFVLVSSDGSYRSHRLSTPPNAGWVYEMSEKWEGELAQVYCTGPTVAASVSLLKS